MAKHSRVTKERKELPWVRFEPATLCSPGKCMGHGNISGQRSPSENLLLKTFSPDKLYCARMRTHS